ncbi:unnamed protein product [Bursaphelenchus okinawaensis]|uniref:Ig-like domain-containing protein n=1 Tax=Bursaphelenchus okinawaensis TaxID=465554 RepID=A0A811KF70_9BILA|nr:unnamed protein product [Bursaphelenchus okinawaensis]CAG9100970.1 unnamed protein product [Bursaphelenchus okinawaensis]
MGQNALWPLLLVCIQYSWAAQRISQEPVNTTVNLGGTALLRCQVEDQKGQVQWTKDGFGLGADREMKSFKRYRMGMEGNNNEYHLQIKNVTLDDDAVYECQLQWADDENPAVVSAKAHLQVLASPRGPFLTVTNQNSETIEAIEDIPIEAKCTVNHGKPAARIVWVVAMDKDARRIAAYVNNAEEVLKEYGNIPVRNQKTYQMVVDEEGGDEEEDDDGYVGITSTIRFNPSKFDGGKHLVCMAVHPTFGGRAHTKSRQMNVLYKPKVTVTLDEKQSDLREGGRAMFKCHVDAQPADTRVYWGKYGDRIKELNQNTAVIENLSMEDHANRVVCNAENKIGRSQGSLNISIHYAPKIMSTSRTQVVPKGDSVSFQCEAIGNPPPTVSWYRRGIHTTQTSVPIASGNTLTLESVHEWHVGEYECMAKSPGFKPATLVHYLHLKGPPIVTLEEPIQSAKRIELKCKVRAKPSPEKVLWYIDGKELNYNIAQDRLGLDEVQTEYGMESKLTIKRVNAKDYGFYNCTAWNQFGMSSAQTHVTHHTIWENIGKTLLSWFVAVPWYVWIILMATIVLLLAICLIWRCCCCCRKCKSSESIKPTKFSDCSDVTVRCEALDEDAQEYFTNIFPSPHSGSEILRKDYISVPQSNPDLDYLPPPVYGSYYQSTYDYADNGQPIRIEPSAYGSYSQSPVLGNDVCVGVYPHRNNVTVRQLNVAPLDTLPEIITPQDDLQRAASRLSTHV